MLATINTKIRVTPEQFFMASSMLVNAGNYAYNLILGRLLGPEVFSGAALLITLLLVLSFLAMTLQLVTAKYSVLYNSQENASVIKWIYSMAIISGLLLGLLVIVFSNQLSIFFQVPSRSMFVIFGCSIPLYFIMSVSRGVNQGKQEFIGLSQSYLLEMLFRLCVTLILLLLVPKAPLVVVSIGILISLFGGIFPNKLTLKVLKSKAKLSVTEKKNILGFLLITCLYECTQIVINNSDILLVKHYFDAVIAGQYAALALIGRVVYFITWMLIMLLLPKLIAAKKSGNDTTAIFRKYFKGILLLISILVLGCVSFPKLIITILFGNEYIMMSPLLWKYAIATALFALANLFVYYFLSLSYYIPVVVTMLFGLLQVATLVVFHNTITQVVYVQIILMSILLLVQTAFYILKSNKI